MLPALTKLNLARNQISGAVEGVALYSVSQTVFPQLFDLNLGHNHISGVIEVIWDTLVSLTNLDLSYNKYAPNKCCGGVMCFFDGVMVCDGHCLRWL